MSFRFASTSSHVLLPGSRSRRYACLLAAAVVGLAASSAFAADPIPAKIAKGSVTVGLAPVASGFTSPVTAMTAPGDPSKLYVVEQTGQVKVVQNGVVQSTPFLDDSSSLVTLRSGYDERGNLGLAFDPNFNNVGTPGYHRVFTYTSEPAQANPTYPLTTPGTVDHQDVLSSWRVSTSNPNVIDPSTRTTLMRIDHPDFNHNSGDLHFGPDGYLYFGDGDGGTANDAGNGHNPTIGNAQDLNSPLGKFMRIDVNGTSRGNYGIPAGNPFAGGAVPEIYAYGFRNPYRSSFDGNRLLVADVGQNNIEEVDSVTAGGNFGWHTKEGTFLFNPSDGTVGANSPGSPAGLIDPLIEYDHDEGIAIVGGFVYHGTKIPALAGKYVFGDFSTAFGTPNGRLFYADLTTGQINEFTLDTGLPLGKFVKGIGEGANGEIYLLTTTVLGPTGTSGQVLEIVPEPTTLAAVSLMTLPLMRRRQR